MYKEKKIMREGKKKKKRPERHREDILQYLEGVWQQLELREILVVSWQVAIFFIVTQLP